MRAERVAVYCLLAGAATLGVAHIALLPPWEGFDEEAHYSALQQIADQRSLPEWNTARLSQVVADYADAAPMRYVGLRHRRAVPRFTYLSFFEAPDDVIARGRLVVHGPPSEPRRYVPGAFRNWEAQHPPLYYIVLVPAYLMTKTASWGTHLFVLRAESYLFAWLALVLGVYTCARALAPAGVHAPDRRWLMIGVAAWPVLFPGWFPEMARLGNDSLCALLAAVLGWIVLRAVRDGPTLRHASVLGVTLGLGWLTKALFIPLTAGLLAFWCARQWRRGGPRAVLALWPHVAVTGGLILVIAGWWYVHGWRTHGFASWSGDVGLLEMSGGLTEGLRQNFTIRALLRFVASFVVRFAWPSTWSLARPAYVFLLPLALLTLGALAAYLWTLRRFATAEPEWLPAWLTVPLIAAFGQHMLVVIALTGLGSGFGGYYLHLLVAPVGPALGLAIGACWRRASTRALWIALSLYSILFAIVISWAQVLLFAGILSRSTSGFYRMPGALPPLLGVPEALERLAVIAFPAAGAMAWLVGGGLVLAGILAARKVVAALPTVR